MDDLEQMIAAAKDEMQRRRDEVTNTFVREVRIRIGGELFTKLNPVLVSDEPPYVLSFTVRGRKFRLYEGMFGGLYVKAAWSLGEQSVYDREGLLLYIDQHTKRR